MENNDKLIAALRKCAKKLCADCDRYEVGCARKIKADAADALANAQTTIASDQRIIQSLRQSCDAFSRMNMLLKAENRDLKAKERHGWWIYKPMYDYGEFACCCSGCGEPTRDNSPEWCSHCGAKMDEEDET